MAKTLLEAVNEIGKRVGLFHGDDDAFTGLTDNAKQRSIDICVQVINEGIDELYTIVGSPNPQMQKEATITLVDGQRSYSLANDLERLLFPFRDITNSQYLYQHPGGYNQMLLDDPNEDDTGLPHTASVSPVDGTLYLNRAPTSGEAGRIYKYQYLKDGYLGAQTDTVPFSDGVFRAMVPAWVCLYRRDMQKEFDAELYTMSTGRAARLVTKVVPREHYNPRGRHASVARVGHVV